MTRNRWMIALAAAFLVGCSSGVLGGILFARFVMLPPHMQRVGFDLHYGGPPPMHRGGENTAMPGGRPGPDGPPPEHLLLRLTSVLELTPEQREHLRPLIDRSRAEFGAVRESLDARIVRELTPEQRTRWNEMQRRHHAADAARGEWPRPRRANPGENGGHR